MTASDVFLAHAQPWLQPQGRNKARTILPLPIFAIIWWFASLYLTPAAWSVLVGYALFNLVVLFALRHHRLNELHTWHQFFHVSSIVSDAVLVILLLVASGPLHPEIFPLYAVLGIKALLYRRYFLWMLLVPTLLGPLYLAASLSRTQQAEVAYWGLLMGSLGFVLLVIVLGQRRLHDTVRLEQQLDRQRQGYDARVAEMESINNDLRVRIRAQQALEESLRAVTGSLKLEQVFGQILDNAMQMLGMARVSAAALSLRTENGFSHHTLALDLALPQNWAEPLARRVVQQQSALIMSDTLREREWRDLYRSGVIAALSVPLIDVNGAIRGALTVLSTQRHVFTPSEARHLNSFGIQACVAINNAELHSQLAQQEAMLEAVLRDIGDGLIVLNNRNEVVMANPVAYQVLTSGAAVRSSLQEQLVRLARDLQGEAIMKLRRELRIGVPDDGDELVFQAFASLVRIAEENPSHVAIVLHDITDHKAEECARTEFISMVSHELRNPLNTLNGFLKVVLQGRAGPLSELQEEFLGLADGQVEQLKSRIKELLEFNRMDAGRLRLQPDWCDIATLVEAACSRLQLQAEQAGLALFCDVESGISSLLVDGERIGQVITNLVENAIKATSAGGTIAIGVELCDTEVQISVTDTGIGIAPEDQTKIFNRFYRAHHTPSNQGTHLGLGLSICQQIVEGHHGRIWVTSEVGKGSRFTFTLPLVQREQTLGMLQTVG